MQSTNDASDRTAGAGVLLFTLGFLAFWANGDNYAAAPLLVNWIHSRSVIMPMRRL
ncbi:MAG: hypothetical protein ACLFP4_04055 [Spirochaetales bacterium]